ncbi:MAG TPA: hypothetical protein VGN44_05700 [Candidatus Angelobacter sp.]
MKFVVEQEQIKANCPSLLDGKKDWMIYAGSVKRKSRLAVDFLDEQLELLSDDSELSFSVVEARAQAVKTHRMADTIRLTWAFLPAALLRGKGKQVNEQYDILKGLIQNVFVLLGEVDLIGRTSRAM